ncbi:hypothetical protein [Halobacteriovorax sp. HLS]|uniref:hypothetical protein n=1 Tax=Halobacteriovorax sp. HLS TaxID=2234000 RepID=UPI000FD721B8|nr:hypothetical protein [Halobacteriovorax sp. HLS]
MKVLTYDMVPQYVLQNMLSRKTNFLGSGNWDLLLCVVQSYIERNKIEEARKCSLLLRYFQEVVFPDEGNTIHHEEMKLLKQDFSYIDRKARCGSNNLFYHFFNHCTLKESYPKSYANEELLHKILKENIIKVFPDISSKKNKGWDQIITNATNGEYLESIVEDVFLDAISYRYNDDCRFTLIGEVCETLFLQDRNSQYAKQILGIYLDVLNLPLPTRYSHQYYLWTTTPTELGLKFGHIDIAIKGIEKCILLGHSEDLDCLSTLLVPYFENNDLKSRMIIKKTLKALEMIPRTQGQILCDVADVFFEKGNIKESFRCISLILDENIRFDEYLFWLLNLNEKSIFNVQEETREILELSNDIIGYDTETSIDDLLEAGKKYLKL